MSEVKSCPLALPLASLSRAPKSPVHAPLARLRTGTVMRFFRIHLLLLRGGRP